MTSVPQQPHPGPALAAERDAEPSDVPVTPRRGGVRTLAAALPAGAVGASLVLVAAGKTWSRGFAAFGRTNLPVHATGTDTTALPGALALVALASLVAVFAVRRTGRYAVAGLLALSGLGVVVMALARRGDHAALDSAAASTAGLAHATATHASTTSWPLVSAAGGLLLLAAGLLALRYGPTWPAMSSRYDRPGTRRPVRARAAASAAAAGRPVPVDPDRAEDLWKALDRGEDPTG
ncbi:TIGR02234 family membrane protein [Streptomyces sp. IBSBF 2435]|uniref:TIGR02234 family membrane protein n=1 Tax=Streptomyces sp. IBSBF 2435 TaxID=2903531 RepID=UPI003FA7EF75